MLRRWLRLNSMKDFPKALSPNFGSLPDLLKQVAKTHADRVALVLDDETMSYAEFDNLVDAVAASLQRDGLDPGQIVAICAQTSLRYVATYYGTLRAGGVVAPLPPSATPGNLTGMLENSEAQWLFLDDPVNSQWPEQQAMQNLKRIALDNSEAAKPWSHWLDVDLAPTEINPAPDWPFNLIYSSGTTGTPKGIVQPWSMRWSHTQRAWQNGYRPDSVLLTGTPLYSNTTLVALLPALAIGCTAVMMGKFDALQFLRLAQKHRVTHTILVPIQYQRILDRPEFDQFDLSSFKAKFSTSAPFDATLKAAVLDRWPGELTEIYGMTEGGGRCELLAHVHRTKLHTVGRPANGHEIRIISDTGVELPAGELGEIVGRSNAMMKGYHRQPEKTREVEWFSPEGLRFIRTGDVGRFDEDGFLILGDRKKDMLISGGFNIYPSDLESELKQHPDVEDCAVVGAISKQWGETPVAFVVLRPDASESPEALRAWVNGRLGKTQRVAKLLLVDELPRNAIGKVLKRQLRDEFTQTHGALD
jgi:acyl-CoA synthetase (AMP-forming)/AMP-acid ligase II